MTGLRTLGTNTAPFAKKVTGETRSAAATDGTDQTSVVQAELDALYDVGGGTLILPSGTVKVTNLTLKNDAATPAKMPAIRLRGQGQHWSGRGTAPQGGTTLQFTGTDTYGLLKSNALGALTLDGITFRNTDTTHSTPFIYTTNTTLFVRGCSFYGAKTNTSCDQDAIVLGGTTQVEGASGWDDGFQGYGTDIALNFFSGIRTAVKLQAFANAVRVKDNTVWSTCGNASGAPFVVDGKPTTGSQVAAGGTIANNLIELSNYKYGIQLANASMFNLRGNDFYDATGTTTAGIFFATTATYNRVVAGFCTGSLRHVYDTGNFNKFEAIDQAITTVQPAPWQFLERTRFYGADAGLKFGPITVDYSGNEASLSLNGGNNPYPKVALMVTAGATVADGVLVSGSTTVTSATAAWTSADVGKPIKATGITANTFIVERVSATTIIISQAATASATGVTLAWGRVGTTYTWVQFERGHIVTNNPLGSAPSGAVDTAAGTGATISVTGTDMAHNVTLTSGTGPTAGLLCHIAPSIGWTASPKIIVQAKDAATAALFAGGTYTTYVSGFVRVSTVNAPAASTAYNFDVMCMQ